MQLSDWERVISTLGVPLSLLIAIGLGIRGVLLWSRPHAERVVAAHVNLLEKCAQTLSKIDANSAINAERIDQLTQHTLDPNGPCQRTVASLSHLSFAVESLGDKCPEVREHTLSMRRVLEE